MANEVDPVLCNTVLLTYQEQSMVEELAKSWFLSKEETLRSLVLKGLIHELS